jgi:hypothetical protein
MSRLQKHLSNNWGWYLFGGGIGTFGTYVYTNYATSKRRRLLLDSIEARMPINSDELLELRSSNEVHTAQLLDFERRLLSGRRPVAPNGMLSLSDLVSAIPGALGRELTEGYALERMLAAMCDNGQSSLRASDSIASLMFLSVDSVDNRLRGMYTAYSHELESGMVPLERARELVRALLLTGQVPLEKRALEQTKPFYSPNDWHELTADVAIERIPDEDKVGGALSESAFKRLLCSDSVCIWGECYRLAEEATRLKAAQVEEQRRLNPPWWQFWRSKPAPDAEAPHANEPSS